MYFHYVKPNSELYQSTNHIIIKLRGFDSFKREVLSLIQFVIE